MKVINALIKKYKISYKKLNIAPTAIEPKNILICKSKAIPIRITPI